ncbi:head-tail connector protein [Salinarimonas sp.]|uniref:head-tail connector protein n=1 Tax=Salinarimonas sp. TaxID=2766526 RepID=UPI00391B109B
MLPLYLAGPAVEPVAVPEMRLWLRIEDEAEDALLAALIKAARLVIEATTRLTLLESTWRLALPRLPSDGVVRLPLAPVIRIDAVRLYDGAGVATLLPASAVRLEARAEPPRVTIAAPSAEATAGGVEIDLAAGFGTQPGAAPAPLVQALRLLVAHWYENRGDLSAEGARASGLPAEILALIAPYRRLRMG